MVSREEVSNLAALARLELPAMEVDKLRQDLVVILGFVVWLKVEASDLSRAPEARALSDNTLRTDSEPHEAGIHTERLLKAIPMQKDG